LLVVYLPVADVEEDREKADRRLPLIEIIDDRIAILENVTSPIGFTQA
jgi:hypothetical protein